MADFPSQVTTETSSPQSSQQQGGNSLTALAGDVNNKMNMPFIKSIPGVLMMAEIGLGLLHWALIAHVYIFTLPVYGWVMFVGVTLWIITTILFFMILFHLQQNLPSVPWPMAVMVYHAVATFLFLTAFISNAAYIRYSFFFRGHLTASAIFGALVTIAYGAGAYFSYLDWKGVGGNAATNTVPA
ncbi:plasmolipin-like [Diretmus argenteus]